jgi:predicted dehydrogenase
MKKIGVGIIGLNPQRGWAHDAHVPALQALANDYAITAACTSRQSSADEAAKALGIAHAFADPAAMARHPDVDLVVVTVKVPEHDRLVRAALVAGKHVWCEWPLAMHSEAGAALAKLADAKGVRHVIGLQSRMSPVIRRVRDLVREGYVGKVRSSTLIGSGMAWGAFTDQANVYNLDAANRVTLATVPFGHFIDAFSYCLSPLVEVQALESRLIEQTFVIETGQMTPKTANDQLLVQARLADGAVASIHYRGGMAKGTNLHWEINGSDGDLIVTSPVLGHLQLAPLQLRGGRGQDQQSVADLEIPAAYVNAAIPLGMGWNVGHAYAALAPCLRDPSQPLPDGLADFHAANRVHRVIETVERAAAEGRRLPIG